MSLHRVRKEQLDAALLAGGDDAAALGSGAAGSGDVLTADGVGGTSFAPGGGTTLPVDDATAIVKGSVDPTKLVRIEADGLTTATTRVLTMPDADITPDDASASRTPTAHKDSHKSGGGDAFAATDLLEAIVKRIQTTTGPTDLLVGAVADGEALIRSGTSIISQALAPLPGFFATIGSGGDYGSWGAAITAFEADSAQFAVFIVLGGSVTSSSTGFPAITKPIKFLGLNRATSVMGDPILKMVLNDGGLIEFENLTIAPTINGPLLDLNDGTGSVVRCIDVNITGGVNQSTFLDPGDDTRFEFVRSSMSLTNVGYDLIRGNTASGASNIEIYMDQCTALSANIGKIFDESAAGSLASVKMYLRNSTVMDRQNAGDASVVLDVFLDGTSLWTDDGGVTCSTKRVHGDNFYTTDMDGLTGLDIEKVLEESTAAVLRIGEGSFTLPAFAAIANSMTVMGSGRDKTTITMSATTLSLQVSATNFAIFDLTVDSSHATNANHLQCVSAQSTLHVERVDFTVSGGATTAKCIAIGGSSVKSSVVDCTFSASSGEIDEGVDTSTGDNVHIARCVFSEINQRAVDFSNGCVDCSIRDSKITLLAPGSGSQVGLLIGGQRIVVSGCTIDCNSTTGSGIDGINVGSTADFVSIDGCTIFGNDNGDGIHVANSSPRDVTITNCKIQGLGDLTPMTMGIRSSDSQRLSIRGCTISNCQFGIQCEDNTQISGCHFQMLSASGGVSTGINVLGVDVTITDCIIEGNANDGTTSAGIELSGSIQRITIQNCTISNIQNASAACIEINSTVSEVAIGGCTLSPSGAQAIEGSGSDNVTISNCNIANTGTQPAVESTSGATKWTVTGCHFSDFASFAIRMVGADHKITGCTFISPVTSSAPLDLDMSGRVIVTGNTIDMTLKTSGNAIDFQSGTPVNGVISNNTIEACPGVGIEISGAGASYYIISDNYINIDSGTGTAISAIGTNGQSIMIQNNIIETAGAGIAIAGHATTPTVHQVVKGNHVTGTGGASDIGINSTSSGTDVGPVIDNNIVVDMGAQGILLNPLSTATVSGFKICGNTVRNCTGHSIEVVDAFRGVMNGNQCLAGSDNGITLTNVEDTVVVGNLVEGHLVAGKTGIIEDATSASNNISANITTNNTANLSLAGSPAAIVNGDNIST